MAASRRLASSSSTIASRCCSAGYRATDRYAPGVLTSSSDCCSSAAALSAAALAALPSGLASEGPGVVAVAYPPLQFKWNCTVSETCAKSSPWMNGAACELVTMQSSCDTLSPTRLATITVWPASLAADDASA